MPAAEAIAYRAQEAQSVQGPYLALAVTLFVLAVVVMAFRLPAIRGVEDVAQDQRHGIRDALRHRHVLFGVMARSEEHTSELQSLMRISYAVFCLKKKKKHKK